MVYFSPAAKDKEQQWSAPLSECYFNSQLEKCLTGWHPQMDHIEVKKWQNTSQRVQALKCNASVPSDHTYVKCICMCGYVQACCAYGRQCFLH